MSLRPTLDFLLYDWLRADTLSSRARFADHSRETFDAVLDTCERIAREKYAPFNRLVDTEEPRFDGEKGDPAAGHARRLGQAYAESRHAQRRAGLRHRRHAVALHRGGGGQRLLQQGLGQHRRQPADKRQRQPADGARHAEMQKAVFRRNEFSGRWSGTMCLSEPQAGSSLSDVATRAVPDGEGFESRPAGPALPPQGQQDVDLGRRA
jgi:alkylation response protein AidB-like acyl-CoA dehydrogenase